MRNIALNIILGIYMPNNDLTQIYRPVCLYFNSQQHIHHNLTDDELNDGINTLHAICICTGYYSNVDCA